MFTGLCVGSKNKTVSTLRRETTRPAHKPSHPGISHPHRPSFHTCTSLFVAADGQSASVAVALLPLGCDVTNIRTRKWRKTMLGGSEAPKSFMHGCGHWVCLVVAQIDPLLVFFLDSSKTVRGDFGPPCRPNYFGSKWSGSGVFGSSIVSRTPLS